MSRRTDASSIPSTAAIYPLVATVGALVYLTPTGNRSSKTADCFSKTVVTETVTEPSSSHTTVIAVSLSVLALLVLVISVLTIIYWCKKKTKQKTSDKDINERANKTSGRFKFDIHTALLAGLGSSKTRQKSFLKQRDSNILVVNRESKDSGPTENVVTGYDNMEELSVQIPVDTSLTSNRPSSQRGEKAKQMTLPNETFSLHNHVPNKTTAKSANNVGSMAINDHSESSEASLPRELLPDPVPFQEQQFEIDVYSDFSNDANSEALKKSNLLQKPVPRQEPQLQIDVNADFNIDAKIETLNHSSHVLQEPVHGQKQHVQIGMDYKCINDTNHESHVHQDPRQKQQLQNDVDANFNNDANRESLNQSHLQKELDPRPEQQLQNMEANFNTDTNNEALNQSHVLQDPVPSQEQQLQIDVDSDLKTDANNEALNQSHVHEPVPHQEQHVQTDRVSHSNDETNSEQSQLPKKPTPRKEQIKLYANFNNDANNDILRKSHLLQEPIPRHEQQVQIDVPNSEQSQILQEPFPRQGQIDFDANSNNDTSNEALKQSHLLQDPVLRREKSMHLDMDFHFNNGQDKNSELQLLTQPLPLHEQIIRKPTIPILKNSTEDHNIENQHIIQSSVEAQTCQTECQDGQKTGTCDSTMASGSSDILEADKRKLDENNLTTLKDEVVRIAYTDDTNNAVNTTTKIDAKCGLMEQPALPNQPSITTDLGQDTQNTAAANGNTVTNPVVKNESKCTNESRFPPPIANIQPEIFITGKKHISNGQPGISTTEMGHRSSIRPGMSTREMRQRTIASGGKSIIDDIGPKMAIDMKERYKESLEPRKTRNTQEQAPNRCSKMDSVSSVSDKTKNDKIHTIYQSPVSNKALQNQKKLQVRKKLMKTKSPLAKTKKT